MSYDPSNKEILDELLKLSSQMKYLENEIYKLNQKMDQMKYAVEHLDR